MNRLVVAAVLATTVAAVAAVLGGWVVGVLTAVAAGGVLAWWLQAGVDSEAARITEQVRGWVDGSRPRTVSPRGLRALKGLAVTLDGVGRDVDTHLEDLARDLPWRRELVLALPQAAVLFGEDGYLVAANDQARDLLRVPDDGERTTMLAAVGNAQLAAAVRRVTQETQVIRVDAELGGRLARATIIAVGGQRLMIIGDRTQERRVEDVRRNFVVNASHELKTPATSIQALAEALVVTADRDPARVPRLVERLNGESQRLVRLVHDLLDLRRLEEDVGASRRAVDLVSVVDQAVADLEDWAQQRGVTIDVHAPRRARVMMEEDDAHLAVRNLVSNAIQYNRDDGTVTVTVTAGWPVVLEVADTGIGIPKADIDRIFERFYRVDIARSRATGGTGLGLSMVRHAVERNGGHLEVESLLGTGSSFRVHLPAASEFLEDPRADADSDSGPPLERDRRR